MKQDNSLLDTIKEIKQGSILMQLKTNKLKTVLGQQINLSEIVNEHFRPFREACREFLKNNSLAKLRPELNLSSAVKKFISLKT